MAPWEGWNGLWLVNKIVHGVRQCGVATLCDVSLGTLKYIVRSFHMPSVLTVKRSTVTPSTHCCDSGLSLSPTHFFSLPAAVHVVRQIRSSAMTVTIPMNGVYVGSYTV